MPDGEENGDVEIPEPTSIPTTIPVTEPPTEVPTAVPATEEPSMAPTTEQPTETPTMPTFTSNVTSIVFVGNNEELEYPLELCEGDCDTDDDVSILRDLLLQIYDHLV